MSTPRFSRALPLLPRAVHLVGFLLTLALAACKEPTGELPYTAGVHGLRWGATVEEALRNFPDLEPDSGGWSSNGSLVFRAPSEAFGDSAQIWLHFNVALGLTSGGLRVYSSNVDSTIVTANRVFGRRALAQDFQRTGDLDDYRVRYDGPGVFVMIKRPIRDTQDYVNVSVVSDR